MKQRPALKDWIIALRPWSFPASSMPALVAFVYTFFQYKQHADIQPNWLWGILAIVGAIIFQISGNLISDYFDYKQGVDREDTFGSSRLLVNKTFSPKTILSLGLIFLMAGTLLGLFLYYNTGWPLLIIGGLGFIAALFYYKFKYMALGDLLIFIVYGPLITLGTYYTITAVFDWEMIALSIPIGCITVNILHANNTRDIAHDKRANIRTFAMQIGVKASTVFYLTICFFLDMKKRIIPILIAACLWFMMFSPWTSQHLNFWLSMSLSALILICMSFILGENLKKNFRFNVKSMLLGVSSACLLWVVFYIGDYLSAILFDFAKPQVASIYGLRDGTESILIALALFFLIGPAEVIFWQGFVQSKMMQQYGDWKGFIITTIIYSIVHIFSFNFMLIMAALVCGAFWGFIYMVFKPRNLVPLIISHALWDVMVFILFPIL